MQTKYTNLKIKFNEIKLKLDEKIQQNIDENQKEKKISDKIDELNQETDILIDEIDKWQM